VVGCNENTEADCGCSEYANDIGCIVNRAIAFSQVRNGAVCELGVLAWHDYVGVHYMGCLISTLQFVWDGLYRCFYWLCCCGVQDDSDSDEEDIT
jgi:hypothetical protein